MASKFDWNGPACRAAIERRVGGGIRRACMFLSDAIKADISQPGTLRYTATSAKTGKALKGQKTVYNFTHSRPGNPPFKQTGELRQNVTWSLAGLVGRVGVGGTAVRKAKALELGTPDMAARPFILPNFYKHMATMRSLIQGTVSPGSLPEIGSNQSRSGHIGAGGVAAGYGD